MSDSSVQSVKRCSKCGTEKPATRAFFPANRCTKSGFGCWCSECFNAYARARRPAKPKPTVAERFWSKVNKEGPVPPHRPELGPCWVWTGGTFSHGYGAFHARGRRGAQRSNNMGAHVYALLSALGMRELPPGRHACHHCDNPLCVRADGHLFLGTPLDNMRDKVAKLRQARGERVGTATMSDEQARAAWEKIDAGVSPTVIARELCVSRRAIYHMKHNDCWGHLRGNAGDAAPEALIQADDGAPPKRL